MLKLKQALAGVALSGLIVTTGAATAFASDDWAAGLMDSDKSDITVSFSCGKPGKAVCESVVPQIVSNVPGHIRINPLSHEKGGSVLTTMAVCAGKADMGIVQADVAKKWQSDPKCAGKIEIFGKPVFPAAVRLIVRRDNDADSLKELVKNANKSGKAILLGTGGKTSGGKVTAENIRLATPEFKRAITLTDDNSTTAMRKLADGQIQGYVIVDSYGKSSKVDSMLSQVDKKGKPLFKVLDVEPPNEFFKERRNPGLDKMKHNVAGYVKYTPGEIDIPGWGNNVDTVSLNYVGIAGKEFMKTAAGEDAVNEVAKALDNGQAVIREATHAPKGWEPQQYKLKR